MHAAAELIRADVASARRANHAAVKCAKRANNACGEYQRHRWDDATLAAREMRDAAMRSARNRKGE